MFRKVAALAVVIVVLVVGMASCAPTPKVVEKVVKETVVVEKEVEVTKVVEKEVEVTKEVQVEVTRVVEKVVTPTPMPGPEKVVILQSVDAVSLDPDQLQAQPGRNIANHIFARLVRRDEESLEIKPDLAESWELINDLTWQFKLRKGIVFHNGEPFTASAVKFSLERANAIPTWGMKQIALDKIEVLDDYTVNIVTKEPRANMLTFLLESLIMPPEYYGTTPEDKVATQPVGAGPYKFVEWVRDDHVTLEAFPEYWGGPAAIKTLVWRVVPEASSRIAELETGGADIIAKVPPDQAQQVKGIEGATVVRVPSGYRMQIGMRHDKGPMQDKRVRQAINYGVNVDRIIEYLMEGNAIRMTSVLNPPYRNPDLKPYPYDPDKAKELLAEAGYPDGFKVVLMSPSGRYTNDLKVSQAVAADLAKIGIEADVQTFEWSVYIDKMMENKLDDMWFIGMGAYYEGQLELNNYAGGFEQFTWHNAEFKTLWDELTGTMDDAKRREILYKIQDLFLEDPPILMLYKGIDLYGVREGLEWATSPVGIYLYRSE